MRLIGVEYEGAMPGRTTALLFATALLGAKDTILNLEKEPCDPAWGRITLYVKDVD